MEIFSNHKRLYCTATGLFILLTIVVTILPAIDNQQDSDYVSLEQENQLTPEQIEGKKVYISNGCVACHTQQVRNIDMDKTWGDRPGLPTDYANNHRMSFWMNTATLMGTERTGPDLTNIGVRQPSKDWHLLHLYQPRATVPQSIMPAYKFLFEIKAKPGKNDVIVNLPDEYALKKDQVVVATKDALNLVAYLQSLKQKKLPDGTPAREFLYKSEKTSTTGNSETSTALNGSDLYAANCMSCHQQNGEGVKGAFPALKNSPIVINDNPEMIVNIIMQGYNPRPEFAEMPAIGQNNNLTAEEITAIINHERTSWGNKARKVTVAEVIKIMEAIKSEQKPLP